MEGKFFVVVAEWLFFFFEDHSRTECHAYSSRRRCPKRRWCASWCVESVGEEDIIAVLVDHKWVCFTDCCRRLLYEKSTRVPRGSLNMHCSCSPTISSKRAQVL